MKQQTRATAAAVAVPGWFLSPALLRALGAEGEVHALAQAYLRAWFPGAVPLVTGIVASRRGEGRAQTAGWLAAELAGHDARVVLISVAPEHARLLAGQPGQVVLPALNAMPDVATIAGRIAAQAKPGRPAVVAMPDSTSRPKGGRGFIWDVRQGAAMIPDGVV